MPRSAAAWVFRLGPAALYLMTAVLLAGRLRAGADGYDGIGFVLAVERFDLAGFAPQPPGYPLFVLLGRLVHRCGVPPAIALSLVSAALSGAGIAALGAAVARAAGVWAGRLSVLLVALSPLGWALGIATLSDGAGMGAVLLAVGVWAGGRRPAAAGAVLGLALGIRPSYAAVVLLLLLMLGARAGRRPLGRAALGLGGAVLLWAVPFALWIGPRQLWTLSLGHARGHFLVFGGSAATDGTPLARVCAAAVGLATGACGPLWPLWAGLVAAARVTHRRPSVLGRGLLAALVAYLGLVLVALPVGGRHLLPAVVAALTLAATVLGGAIESSAGAGRRGLVLATVTLLAGGALLGGRGVSAFGQLGPGGRLAQHVAERFPPGTPLYGATAARFLDLRWGRGSAHQTLYFGDVLVEAERMSRLPEEVLLTSEVQSATPRRLRTLARFCYDDRVPPVLRFEPYPDGCVELRAYRFFPPGSR